MFVYLSKQTDEIEGEEHEHSVTSKINLVDLAGSERQSHSKTSGDRLRVCRIVLDPVFQRSEI